MFAHLHNHTEYSILDSTNKVRDCVKKIKELGMTACAITDHGAMYGVIAFYKAMKEEGLNPVLGCEVYVTDGDMRERKLDSHGHRYSHLVLLAENNTGYENLMQITSRGYTEGFYYKPRVDHALLEQYHEGIIALSACVAGEIPRAILRGDMAEAESIALEYVRIFGKNNFFLEIQDHGLEEEKISNKGLVEISKKTGIPLVATNDCHYTERADAQAHDVLICIQQEKLLTDQDRMMYQGDSFYLKSEEEMKAIFPYAPEAVENTQKIADRCHVEIEFHHTKMPAFDVPGGLTAWEYLNRLCRDGLKARYPGDDGTVEKQMEYELSVIRQMGYVEYFLIVQDFIQWAKTNGVAVGPGRGSAAGSVVSYVTGITDIDPVRYSLLFERFLNPERVSMPDIDVDFCMKNRYKVIEYVTGKYGRENVGQIITIGTLAAKQAIRDVGKALGMPFHETSRLSKLVPEEPGMTIQKALTMEPELAAEYQSNIQTKRLLGLSMRLEGLPRQTGTHAAGVIICDRPLTSYIPVALNQQKEVVSQFSMTEVEELGLLKMDFLGLRTLTAISEAKRSIQKNHGVQVDEQLAGLDDKDVYTFISTGKTSGVFQLESAGMQKFMAELKPECIEDLIAGVALYRPGPMDFIPDYIKGKEHPEKIVYDCDAMEPILRPTYGTIIYQEQVMQIVRDLGGYTLGRSDLVRRAMSKKKAKVMEEERQNFVYGNEAEHVPGCLSNGVSEKTANKIYDDMTDFAKYAFNKCVSGDTVIMPVSRSRELPTVEEMYLCAHDIAFAEENGWLPLRKKYLRTGNYGMAFSMFDDGRIKKNTIKDIRQSGERRVYRLETESGRYIECTGNHKFPTPAGVRKLSELAVGDILFAINGYRGRNIHGTPCRQKLRGKTGRLEDRIASIQYVGMRMTYDVSMADPAHNFAVDNGLITCNSHAAAYAVISYQTAWLKYYYPVEYMAAVLTSVVSNADKMKEYMSSCKESGIHISCPDINRSGPGFTPEKEHIILGLAAVTNVSVKTAENICRKRPEDGFPSFDDALHAVQEAGGTKTSAANLIKSGAFDCLGGRRSQYLAVYEGAMKADKKAQKKNIAGQMSLADFTDSSGLFHTSLPDLEEFNREKILGMEKEACGMYLSGHPLGMYRSFMAAIGDRAICALCQSVKTIYTKRGQKMAFLMLETVEGETDAVIFPKVFESMHLEEDEKYVIWGNGDSPMECRRAVPFRDMPADIWVRFGNANLFNEEQGFLQAFLLRQETGNDCLYAVVGRQMCCLGQALSLKADDILDALRDRYGAENVALTAGRNLFGLERRGF
ncbi:MAG: DNA polymerase III subunit alpha [Clostridiales bacterium]|nr:DNA polymerase III subunit alpha [Clostridiales bacterium]